jgi:predicted TIM-barrel fold metal-dependent hydrolase
MRSWWHPISRIKFLVYASAAGITEVERADQQFVQRLAALGRGTKTHGRYLVVAFDRHYRPDGTTNPAKTEFYVPNDYLVQLAEAEPDLFVPAVSIHPYRTDALAELRRWAERGVRVVKWLPNAMGIDPADQRCDAFYRELKDRGMFLLTHAGVEKAVEADEDQELGNPLRLRRPLELGVKVIVAHCASLGQYVDSESPRREKRESFDLFMRLMVDKRYEGQLFGDISAMTQFNRLPRPIVTMLARSDLHGRLVNGSDYPLPAINIIIRTRSLLKAGLGSRPPAHHREDSGQSARARPARRRVAVGATRAAAVVVAPDVVTLCTVAVATLGRVLGQRQRQAARMEPRGELGRDAGSGPHGTIAVRHHLRLVAGEEHQPVALRHLGQREGEVTLVGPAPAGDAETGVLGVQGALEAHVGRKGGDTGPHTAGSDLRRQLGEGLQAGRPFEQWIEAPQQTAGLTTQGLYQSVDPAQHLPGGRHIGLKPAPPQAGEGQVHEWVLYAVPYQIPQGTRSGQRRGVTGPEEDRVHRLAQPPEACRALVGVVARQVGPAGGGDDARHRTERGGHWVAL